MESLPLRFLAAFSMVLLLGACAASDAISTRGAAAAAPEHIAAWQARFGRTRPVVAVVGANAGTELIDFVAPYSILARSGAADVFAVATGPGPMKLRPAVTIAPHATLAQFDERFPQGADYVVVPAIGMGSADDTPLAPWLRAQSAKGATVVSICDGALVVARAGLFKGHRATGHWFTRPQREREFPDTRWLANTRYVADGNIVSSAGVSAALPVSVALVEAIAGRDRAEQTARDIGLARWDNTHDSERFGMSLSHYLTFARNAWFAPHERVELAAADGMDELALALTADSLGRTLRGHVRVVGAGPVRTLDGLTVLPAERPAADAAWRIDPAPAAGALDRTLAAIDGRYGRATGDFVTLQLEYPR